MAGLTSPPVPLSVRGEGEPVGTTSPSPRLRGRGGLWGRRLVGLTNHQATPKDGVRGLALVPFRRTLSHSAKSAHTPAINTRLSASANAVGLVQSAAPLKTPLRIM